MSDKILVTGGAGFIGASLVAQLVRLGETVTVIDRVEPGTASALGRLSYHPAVSYVRADIRDLGALRAAAPGHDVVFHLSSNTENRADRSAADADFEVTAGGTVRLLQALADAPPRVFVLCSSQLVYGDLVGHVTEARATAGPTSRFAAGKLAAEAFASAYAHEYGMRAVACRLSNIVGPGISRGIVHDLVANLDQDRDVIRVLGDGSQTRSFLHVSDCVSALITAAEQATGAFSVYNVCNTDTTSVRRVAEIVAETCPGSRPAIEFEEGDRGWAGDVPTLLVDSGLLGAAGWRPRYTSDEAVRFTAEDLHVLRGRAGRPH